LSILNPLYDAVAWVMMRIHAVLAVPFGPASGVTWGLSIVLLVVLMRLIMVPLFIKQRNSMWKMQSHMPQLQELRKRFKNDKTRLNEETMKFYKENGVNPLAGCCSRRCRSSLRCSASFGRSRSGSPGKSRSTGSHFP
jgi:YidC/Oxa1 family membrane protein insertase